MSGSNLTPEQYAVGQFFSSLITAQNSCPVHEQCDSTCQRRLGVDQYHVLSSGERTEEVDMRAALESATQKLSLERSEPLTIPADALAFSYAPLERPAKTVRLLKIKPAIFRADPVDCELTVFELDTAPEYGALSYCWGTDAPDRKVLCNGRVFNATPNLERGLKALRAAFPPGTRETYIWADAISINQGDDKEKSEQIMLMKRIYSSAGTVYVSLGSLAGMTLPVGEYGLKFGDDMGGFGQTDTLTHSGDPAHPFHHKTAFMALTQPWFTRTWVIQELVLAKKAKYLFHGNIFTQSQLDGILSKEALRANPAYAKEMMSSGDVIMRSYLNYQKMLAIKQLYLAGKKDALNFIQMTRDFAASEPKDKIFGLLALLTENDRGAFAPHYSKDVGEVYRRFAALQVQQGRALLMLNSAGLQRRKLSGLPTPLASWVPDWTAQESGAKVIAGLRPVPYAASGSLKPKVELIGEAGVGGLKAHGLAIDTIETIVPFTVPGAVPDAHWLDFHDRMRAGFDHWVERLRLQNKQSAYGNDVEAFVRTLLMDDTYIGPNAIIYSSPIHFPVETYEEAVNAYRAGADRRMTGQRMSSVQTFQMQVTTTCVYRSFAMTKGGRIGLVPQMAREDDIVVVFWGSTVPHVIRPAAPQVGAGKYVLLGDAYIHGVMSGELLKPARTFFPLKSQDFTLA